jgi:hypothetical protein
LYSVKKQNDKMAAAVETTFSALEQLSDFFTRLRENG